VVVFERRHCAGAIGGGDRSWPGGGLALISQAGNGSQFVDAWYGTVQYGKPITLTYTYEVLQHGPKGRNLVQLRFSAYEWHNDETIPVDWQYAEVVVRVHRTMVVYLPLVVR